VNWSRELIGRAGYYIHLRGFTGPNEDEILVSNSSFFQSVDGGQTFPQRQLGRRQPRHLWDPKDAERFAITHDAGITIRPSMAAALSACNCRSVSCITRRSTARSRITSTRTCRTTARCAGRASPPKNAGAGYNGSGKRVGSRPRRMRVGLHHSRSLRSNIVWSTCYGNKVTRFDHRTKIARSVAPGMIHTRRAAAGLEVSLPLDGAAGDRIPSTTTTSTTAATSSSRRRPAGQSWSVISPDLVDAGFEQDSSRPAASSATTSGSRALRDLRNRAVGRGEGADLGPVRTTARSGTRRTAARSGTTYQRMSTHARWGVVSKIEPSHFSGGTGRTSRSTII